MHATLKGIVIGSICSMLVLFAATAVAGTGIGAVFNLGQTNTVNASSALTGNSGGPQLKVLNANAAAPSILSEAGGGTGIAVYGKHTTAAGAGAAVRGDTASTASAAFGVYGLLTSATPAAGAAAVKGESKSTNGNGYGVFGVHTGSGTGVFGKSNSGYGIYGQSMSGTAIRADGGSTGLYASGGVGVYAYSQNTAVQAQSGNGTAIRANAFYGPGLIASSGQSAGVEGYGDPDGGDTPGVLGEGPYGVEAIGDGGIGVHGTCHPTYVGDTCEAAHFDGDVSIAAGYLKVNTVSGGPPPATDCDQASEAGRLAVRTDGPPNAYACTGSMWVAL